MKQITSIGLIIFSVLNIYSQEENVQETVISSDRSSECANNRGQGKHEDGSKTGFWRYFYPDCQISSSGNYVDGKKNGVWNTYNKDGSIYRIENLKVGKRHGEQIEYHINANLFNEDKSQNEDSLKIKLIENYIDGVKNGKYLKYYAKKNFLSEKGEYKDGLKSGFWEFYYFNDTTKKSEGLYKADKRVGVWKSYGSKGNLFQIWNHDTNEIKEFNPYTKKVEEEGLHVDGKRIGIWKEYYQNEQLKFEKEYLEGKLWNILKYHDENGNNLDIGTFKNGNGILKIYDRHGTPTQNHPYEEGKRKNIIYLEQ